MRFPLNLLCALTLGLALGLSFNVPALALEAHVKTRTAFCPEPRENCLAIFYLNPGDQIKIENQSIDGKWLRIQHVLSQKIAWVLTQDIKLISVNRLIPQLIYPLTEPTLALVNQDQFLQTLSNKGTQILQSLNPTVQKWQGISDLKAKNLRAFMPANDRLNIFAQVETDGQTFVQEIHAGYAQDQPHFQTILRLNQAQTPWSVAPWPNDGKLILGQGEGPWGKSLLVALDQQGIPLMLIQEPADILNYLPPEIRTGIRTESLRLHDLDAQGALIATAYNGNLRRDMLLRVTPSAQSIWEFGGVYYWPKQLPFRADSQGLQMRFWHEGEQNFVMLRTETSGPGFLAYFAGGNESLTLQKLESPLLDAAIIDQHFWSLHANGVYQWLALSDGSQ